MKDRLILLFCLFIAAIGVAGPLTGCGSTASPPTTTTTTNQYEWRAMGEMDSDVLSLVSGSSNNLYAGGFFTSAGGETIKRIARWDGSAWSGLGSGMNGAVFALAYDASGENLYAGGSFTSSESVTFMHIARWDTSNLTWEALGSGMNAYVYALALDASGNLYAGGSFTSAGGAAANRVAKWNNLASAWEALGDGLGGTYAKALIYDNTRDILYAGGDFITAEGISVNRIARWNGSDWQTLGSGMNGNVYALALDGSGNLYAGGSFTTAGGVAANRVARWNVLASTWEALGGGVGSSFVAALAHDTSLNYLYAGGDFLTAGGITVNGVAGWDGTTWEALGNGVSGTVKTVKALAYDPSGDILYVGGNFTSAGGITADNIARWVRK